MRDTVTCPSCHARLRLPEERPPGGMTCPRCLAEVPYLASPAIQTAPLTAPPPAIQPEPAALAPLPRCPQCGERAEPEWIFCPYCEEPLRPDRGRRRGTRVDTDVQRDGKGVKISVVLLAVLGAIGILFFFGSLFGRVNVNSVIGGVVFLMLVTLINTAIMFYRTRHDPSKARRWTGRAGHARDHRRFRRHRLFSHPGCGYFCLHRLFWRQSLHGANELSATGPGISPGCSSPLSQPMPLRRRMTSLAKKIDRPCQDAMNWCTL